MIEMGGFGLTGGSGKTTGEITGGVVVTVPSGGITGEVVVVVPVPPGVGGVTGGVVGGVTGGVTGGIGGVGGVGGGNPAKGVACATMPLLRLSVTS